MGRYNEAVEAYRNALEIKPDEIEICYHLGSALTELKKYNEAIEIYKSALKVKPTDSEMLYNISVNYVLLRKHDIALDNLRKAIELDVQLKKEAKHDRAFSSIFANAEFKELVS
jgi:tetratricopeptide (TPR) repeat protein